MGIPQSLQSRQNALVGLIVMVEGIELWNRKWSPRDRRRIAVLWRRLGRQGSSKDCRRVVELSGENQEVAFVYGRLVQCIDFQMVRYCGKEGTKKAYRREKECGNSGMRKCVSEFGNAAINVYVE